MGNRPLEIAAWRPVERSCFVSGRPGITALEFSTRHQLEAIVAPRQLDAVVIPLGAGGLQSVPIVSALASDRRLQCPVVAEIPGRPLAYDHLVQLIVAGCDVRPALQGLEFSVDRELTRLRNPDHVSARGFILSNLAPVVPRHLADILIPAILIGGTRVRSQGLEAACGLNGRTIRGRLLNERRPSPAKILGFVAGVYLCYRTEVDGISLREAAYRSDFESEDALRLYLKCRTGVLPSDWQRMGLLLGLRFAVEKLGAQQRNARSAGNQCGTDLHDAGRVFVTQIAT